MLEVACGGFYLPPARLRQHRTRRIHLLEQNSTSSRTLAVSLRLSFFDGESYSQMRRNKGNSGAGEMIMT